LVSTRYFRIIIEVPPSPFASFSPHRLLPLPPPPTTAASTETQGEDIELAEGVEDEAHGNTIIGNIEDRNVIVVDDIIDTAHSFGETEEEK
jgi:phosphoribosylpyrophosphate synthetase